MLFCFHLGQRNVYFVQWKEAKMSKAWKPLPIGQDVSYEPYWKCNAQFEKSCCLATCPNHLQSPHQAQHLVDAIALLIYGESSVSKQLQFVSRESKANLQMATPLSLPTDARLLLLEWTNLLCKEVKSTRTSLQTPFLLLLPPPTFFIISRTCHFLCESSNHENCSDSQLLTIYSQGPELEINVRAKYDVVFLQVICDEQAAKLQVQWLLWSTLGDNAVKHK